MKFPSGSMSQSEIVKHSQNLCVLLPLSSACTHTHPLPSTHTVQVPAQQILICVSAIRLRRSLYLSLAMEGTMYLDSGSRAPSPATTPPHLKLLIPEQTRVGLCALCCQKLASLFSVSTLKAVWLRKMYVENIRIEAGSCVNGRIHSPVCPRARKAFRWFVRAIIPCHPVPSAHDPAWIRPVSLSEEYLYVWY